MSAIVDAALTGDIAKEDRTIEPIDDATQIIQQSLTDAAASNTTECSDDESEERTSCEGDKEESPEDISFLLKLEAEMDADMERIRLEAHQALEQRMGVGKKLSASALADEIAAARQAASCDINLLGLKPKDPKQVKTNLGYGAKKRIKP